MILRMPLDFTIYFTCLSCNILYLSTYKTKFLYRNKKCKRQAVIYFSQMRYCLADFISIYEDFWFICHVPCFHSRVLGKKR